MGKSAVKGLLRWMPVGATWMLAAVTIAASRSGHYHPDSSVVMPLLGLAVPILLVSCLITALCWALARKKWAIVPLAAFFFNWEYLTAVVRFGSTDDDVPATAPAPNREGKSGGCLTVATYNVHHFGNEITGYSCKEIARYMQQRHVDVLCFQEFGDNPHFTTDSLRRTLSHWPYALIPADDSIRGILPVAVFSRYPLAGGRFFTYPRSSNCSMACDIVLGADTLRLLNNHLQTTSVSQNRRKWERELHPPRSASRTGCCGNPARELREACRPNRQHRPPCHRQSAPRTGVRRLQLPALVLHLPPTVRNPPRRFQDRRTWIYVHLPLRQAHAAHRLCFPFVQTGLHRLLLSRSGSVQRPQSGDIYGEILKRKRIYKRERVY